jgi:hypothetical protein
MKNSTRRFIAIAVVGLALITPIKMAFADSEKVGVTDSALFKRLSAEWWQWALSIPTSVNPMLDTTGQNGVVGQRGSIWFLAGTFGGGTVTRTCAVPEGRALFFPVINQINFNTPNVCGQDSNNIPVSVLRAASATFINGATKLSVTFDGKRIKDVIRVQSEVFEVALPKNNVFNAPCTGANLGDVPAGIYSPAVDEGFYVLLDPLDIGKHALHFHAENPSQGVTQDVTYNLTVVPVLEK